MRITTHSSRRLLPLVAALLAGAALTACGSSGSTNSAASAAAAGAGATGGRGAQLAACLKSHGVTLPPGFGRFRGGVTGASGSTWRFGPPGAGRGGGLLFGGGAGGPGGPGGASGGGGFRGRFANNPKLAAAFQACAGSARPNFNNSAVVKRFRAQRVAVVSKFVACVKAHGFSLPKPSFSGGPVFPLSLQKNKKFLAAARPCVSQLQFRPGPGGGAGATPGAAPA
jgi:hypothetical protein